MAVMTYREALNMALREEMRRDGRVFVIGEEVGLYEGAYKVTQGLLKEFGPRRVVDTPICESGFTGVGIGAAMVGLRPVVEMMTFNFALIALDQIVNTAAKLHYMSGGQFNVPIVIRGPGGPAAQLAAQHSQSMETYFYHVPGLKVVRPTTPMDAKGLLKSAIRDENPVIFTRFEPDYLFDTGYRVPALDQFKEYLWLGMTHIFLGYDHVAFLLALLFVKKFRDLVKIVTAFSVAHTLTLVLAALGFVSLPSRIVETAIAASIVYVAAENIWRDAENTHRWRLTFVFGLIHGFGFATVLRELGLPSDGLVRSLLAFNLGVELGQLAIAAVSWPAILWISKRPWAARARVSFSAVLLIFGAAWLLDRALALGLMPL